MLNREIRLKLVKLSVLPFPSLGSLFDSDRSFIALPISAYGLYSHPFHPSQPSRPSQHSQSSQRSHPSQYSQSNYPSQSSLPSHTGRPSQTNNRAKMVKLVKKMVKKW